MSGRASIAFIVGAFGLPLIFGGGALIVAGLMLGFAIGFGDFRLDRRLLDFDSSTRWKIIKTAVIGGPSISLLAATFAYWWPPESLRTQEYVVTIAAAGLGLALGALAFEFTARRRVRP